VWVVAGLHAPASEEGTPEDYAFDRGWLALLLLCTIIVEDTGNVSANFGVNMLIVAKMDGDNLICS
jgi:hypothetical protein